jgi:hypothetical protein
VDRGRRGESEQVRGLAQLRSASVLAMRLSREGGRGDEDDADVWLCSFRRSPALPPSGYKGLLYVNGCGRQGNYTFTQILQALKDQTSHAAFFSTLGCRVRVSNAGKGA